MGVGRTCSSVAGNLEQKKERPTQAVLFSTAALYPRLNILTAVRYASIAISANQTPASATRSIGLQPRLGFSPSLGGFERWTNSGSPCVDNVQVRPHFQQVQDVPSTAFVG